MRRALRIGVGALLGLAGGTVLTSCDVVATFAVNTFADGVDAAPGDGVCEMTAGTGNCSLRAAIGEANALTGTIDIPLPSGTYTLTLPGNENANATGDLDVTGTAKVTITGQGVGARITGGGDRQIDVHAGNFTLSKVGLTGTGEGMFVRGPAVATVIQSAITGGSSIGLRADGAAQVAVFHSTISGNAGSGIDFSGPGMMDVEYSTVTNNGNHGIVGNAQRTIGRSIVFAQANGNNCTGPITNNGWNVTNATCGSGPGDAGSLSGLGALTADLVPYHPLLPGASVIDSIPASAGLCGTFLADFDQRGTPRPSGPVCDRGAIEAASNMSLIVNTPLDSPDNAPGDGVCEIGNGSCSLRAAITETNLRAGSDTITLAASPVLAIGGANDDANTTGDFDIRDSLRLEGAGRTIDGNQIDRVLDHHDGWLTMREVTVTDGLVSADSSGADGGGVQSQGTLEIQDAAITANRASRNGGGVAWRGSAILDQSEIRGNTAGGAGGGLYANGGATISASTVAGNEAEGGGGGGIAISLVSVRLSASAVLDNVASANGGGVSVTGGFFHGAGAFGQLEADDSTITGNTAASRGGAIYGNLAGIVDLRGVTVVENQGGPGLGGGVDTELGGTVAASVLSENGGADCKGLTSNGHNLIRTGTCAVGPGDLAPQDPVLAPLGDYGGPTLTRPPHANSPLLDVIPVGTAGQCDASTPTDQRGEPRPGGAGCDIGAVEGDDGGIGVVLPLHLVVDTAADGVDSTPGDGVCAKAGGGCTLRAAITETNTVPYPGNDITVGVGVDPVLSLAGAGEDANLSGDLDVLAAVTIHGAGATVAAGGLDRVLDLHAGAVAIDELTVSGGRLGAGQAGAGILVRGGSLSLVRSTVSGNQFLADGGLGGGIATLGAATASVDRSTISGNATIGFSGKGGGVDAGGSTFTSTFSTFSGNSAFAGSAVNRSAGTVTLTATTVAGGYGGWAVTGGTSITLKGSLIAQGAAYACSPGITSVGVNVAFDNSCGAGMQVFDPVLGPLGDHGGPTQTHVLALSSYARDLIPLGAAGLCDVLGTDQRGSTRPVGGGCDVGSVEGSAHAVTLPLDLIVDTAADGADAVPGDGVCADAGGDCTLRAAVTETNANPHAANEITIAAGIDPVLALPGEENANDAGDIDITWSVAIHGDGATVDGAQLDRVFELRAGAVVIDDLTVTGGHLINSQHGAGILVGAGSLTMHRSTVANNTFEGDGGRGGGIAVEGTATATIESSTISGNQVPGFSGRGGGISSQGGAVTVRFSTISGNGAFVGTGVSTEGGSVSLLATTVAGGYGGWALGGSGISAIGVVVGSGATYACWGSVSSSWSMAFDTTCGVPTSWTTGDALLGALADNGGPTATQLPAPGSPARNLIPLGTASVCDVLGTDQRGAVRPLGAGCDAGSVESP